MEFWPWGYFNLEFLASFGGLSRLEVFGLALSLVVETQKWKKSLKSHRIGKITTQQARTHHVNKVRRFLLRISTSIYILRQKLLHFGLMLHFASKVVTFRVNVTFCVNCYILRRNKCYDFLAEKVLSKPRHIVTQKKVSKVLTFSCHWKCIIRWQLPGSGVVGWWELLRDTRKGLNWILLAVKTGRTRLQKPKEFTLPNIENKH